MKVRRARAVLSTTWVVGSAPVILLVTVLGFAQGYDNPDDGWLWMMPLLFPLLGTIIGSWTVGHNEADDYEVTSGSIFWLTIVLSAVYFAILYGALFIGIVVYKEMKWDSIIRSSNWYLGTFQWLISTALTKFFIENIRPESARSTKTRRR